MFTSCEYQKLHNAAEILYDKGLLSTLSEKSLVCLLAMLINRQPTDSLPRVAQRLGWSEKRTQRYLTELTIANVAKVTKSQRKESGQITPRCYHLVVAETAQTETPLSVPKSGIQHRTPRLDPKLEPQTRYPEIDHGKTPAFKPKVASNDSPSGQKCPRCHAQKHNTTTPPCCCVNKTTTNKGGLQRRETTDPQQNSPKRAATEKSQLAKQLEKVGVEGDMVKELLENYPPERIASQLEMLPYRSAIDKPSVLIGSIRKNYSPPPAYLDAKKQQHHAVQSANETQERFARIRAEATEGKKRMERLVALEKQLSASEKNILRRDAEKRVRQSLRRAWPQQKPLPESLLNAEYYRLIESRYDKRESGTTSQPRDGEN